MRHLCIFINILQDRSNAYRDSNLAVRVFSKLNYQLEMHHDVSSRELTSILETARSLICSAAVPYDSLTVFVGAHGSAEGLQMRDGERVCVEDIVGHFMPRSCPALIGKPKLFFFQHCRPFLYTHSVSRDRNIEEMVQSAGDMLIALSTREGCTSLRDEQGTLFFQAVLHQIESGGVSHVPLSTLLAEAVERVKHESFRLSNQVQNPQIFSSLTRRFYFSSPPPPPPPPVIASTVPSNYSSFFSCYYCGYSHSPTVPCHTAMTRYVSNIITPFNYSSHMTSYKASSSLLPPQLLEL